MKKYPAFALIELSSISTGIITGDAILKAAPVSILKSGTVHNGKYLLLFGGSVASVEESYNTGIAFGSGYIINHIFLPNVHQQIYDCIQGNRNQICEEAIGIFETNSVAALIQSTDAAVKSTKISIIEIRLANDIGGKGLVLYNGKLEEIKEAISVSYEKLSDPQLFLNSAIIPNISREMAKQIQNSTSFDNNEFFKLKEGEI